MWLAVLFCFVVAANAFCVPDPWSPYEYVAYYNETSKQYTVQPIRQPPPQGVTTACRALYNASFRDLGWDYVHIAPTKEFMSSKSAEEVFYAAGFTEGFLTASEIAIQMTLWSFRKEVKEWIATNRAFMETRVKANNKLPPAQRSKFWTDVGGLLSQIRGLADGYTARGGTNRPLTEENFFYWNYRFEIWEINAIVHGTGFMTPHPASDHCSALIKVTSDDLFVSQNSWMSYDQTLGVRHYKTYELWKTVSFSGYPGQMHSGDDWYITSAQLVAQETTYEVSNANLTKLIVPQSVPEFLRVMVANFEATSGDEWGEVFANSNSGTYNNQYMVVDMKLFTPGKPLQNNTLWIHEQMPGSLTSADVTDVLRTTSYFASYNIPYFEKVRQLAGYKKLEEEQGSFWSYTNYSRAEIFRHKQHQITDLNGMKDIMRYNNYLKDPYSKIPNCSGTTTGHCVPPYSAMLSIASRGDLNPPGNASNYGPLYRYVGQRNHGAVDAKIASWSRLHSARGKLVMKGVVVMGPPANISNVYKPFRWSTSPFAKLKPKDGMDVYEFNWIEFDSCIDGGTD